MDLRIFILSVQKEFAEERRLCMHKNCGMGAITAMFFFVVLLSTWRWFLDASVFVK